MAYRKVEVSASEIGDLLMRELAEEMGTSIVDLPLEAYREALEGYGIVATDQDLEAARSWLKSCLDLAITRIAAGER